MVQGDKVVAQRIVSSFDPISHQFITPDMKARNKLLQTFNRLRLSGVKYPLVSPGFVWDKVGKVRG